MSAARGDVLGYQGVVRPGAAIAPGAPDVDVPFVRAGADIRLALRPDATLSTLRDLDACLRYSVLPWQRAADGLVVAASGTAPGRAAWLRARFGNDLHIVAISRPRLMRAIEARFQTRLSRNAVHALARATPALSARRVVTRAQTVLFIAALAMVCCGFAFWPLPTVGFLAGLLTCLFIANIAFRLALVLIGAEEPRRFARTPICHDDLPLYTVLVPLYREANMLAPLVRALRRLAYPPEKLDIKLVIEADDHGTLRAAMALELPPWFEIVRVPPSHPRTKPKACNYALAFARGEFTVIFDAEDRPEPDQLARAAAAFRMLPPDYGCLQARLNFYNRDQNWLTRLFALDYALWFDYLLPGLDRLRVPLPLGGTSNHFRTAHLRAIHGWDPFNVTEDADIGIRMARLGLKVATFESTTFEEAASTLHAWFQQRSRWLKGYMQTWLVHMRNPLALYRHGGLRGFIAFQLFIAGTFLSALSNIVLWCVFGLSFFFPLQLFSGALGLTLTHLSLVSLIAGNAGFIYLAMLGPYRRGWLELVPFALLAPVYWLLVSAAAYHGLAQLLTRPFYWAKTPHGFGRCTPS